jgi:hypothetical protein
MVDRQGEMVDGREAHGLPSVGFDDRRLSKEGNYSYLSVFRARRSDFTKVWPTSRSSLLTHSRRAGIGDDCCR